jgi:TorA maturation chaperone TorD
MDKEINVRNIRTSSFARLRNESYVLLASLLGQPPGANLRNVLQELTWDEDIPNQLGNALAALRTAGGAYSVSDMQLEFNKLFIGLGSGEIIPYASWYLEKKIQSRPLVGLRTDLYRLGIVRQDGDCMPEDAAASLCEVMVIISGTQGDFSPTVQAGFFERHLAAWMGLFFQDLQKTKSAAFYGIVGRFGAHFMECESRYLGCHLNLVPLTKRRSGYENGACRQPA